MAADSNAKLFPLKCFFLTMSSLDSFVSLEVQVSGFYCIYDCEFNQGASLLQAGIAVSSSVVPFQICILLGNENTALTVWDIQG